MNVSGKTPPSSGHDGSWLEAALNEYGSTLIDKNLFFTAGSNATPMIPQSTPTDRDITDSVCISRLLAIGNNSRDFFLKEAIRRLSEKLAGQAVLSLNFPGKTWRASAYLIILDSLSDYLNVEARLRFIDYTEALKENEIIKELKNPELLCSPLRVVDLKAPGSLVPYKELNHYYVSLPRFDKQVNPFSLEHSHHLNMVSSKLVGNIGCYFAAHPSPSPRLAAATQTAYVQVLQRLFNTLLAQCLVANTLVSIILALDHVCPITPSDSNFRELAIYGVVPSGVSSSLVPHDSSIFIPDLRDDVEQTIIGYPFQQPAMPKNAKKVTLRDVLEDLRNETD